MQKRCSISTSRLFSSVPEIFLTFIFLAAIVQAWATRHEMNADGISYLEHASAYFHHSWQTAISTYWNPLYPLLLAFGFTLTQRFALDDFVLAHSTNLVIFVLSLLGFRYFYRELLSFQEGLLASEGIAQLSGWTSELLGLALFFSCSLDLITLGLVTADLLISAIVFTSFGLLLNLKRNGNSLRQWPQFVLLGLVLAAGYLAKPVMLLFALMVFAVALLGWQRRWFRMNGIAAAAGVFSVIAGLCIVLISSQAHRPTISDNGRLTYLFMVDGQPFGYSHGVAMQSGAMLKHPARRIHDRPAVYEFASPISGSCPIWYEPVYWYEGVRVHFSALGQARQLLKNSWTLARMILVRQAPLCVALLALVFAFGSNGFVWTLIARHWIVLVPTVILLLANLVISLQARLVAPYVVVLWACVLGSLRPFANQQDDRWWRSAVLAASVLLSVGVMVQLGSDLLNAERGTSSEASPSAVEQRAIALGLQRSGVPRDAGVAFVGNSISQYWAHIARIRIIAEVPIEERSLFINASAGQMKSTLDSLTRTGALAVISPQRPTLDEGWKPIQNTSYFIHLLAPLPRS